MGGRAAKGKVWGLHDIQVWQNLFQVGFVGSRLVEGNSFSIILIPAEVCCVFKVTDVPGLLEGEYFPLSP